MIYLCPSQILDLSNPATFRDLSKPMGAQTEKRKRMFIQRYEEVEGKESEGIHLAQFYLLVLLYSCHC